MAGCFERAVNEVTRLLRENASSTAEERDQLLTKISEHAKEAIAEHVEIGYDQQASQASVHLALEESFCAHVRGNETEARKSTSSSSLPLLKWVFDLALLAANQGVCAATTPFVLLEIALEARTIEECKEIWDILEERRDLVASSKFVPIDGRKNTKSKLALLRISNSLLRRLSQKNDTEFCGRIVMFLAYVYPLSERSGVNLKGEINTANAIAYEDEKEFKESEANAMAEEELRRGKSAGTRRGTTTSSSGDDSASNIQNEASLSVDYPLYHSFWDMQRFSTNPELPFEKIKHWKDFTSDIEAILTAFGDFEIKSDPKVGVSSKSTNASSQTTKRVGFSSVYNPKFLTSSRLFRLQLRDPEFRRNVLCQILIICDRLLSSAVEMPAAYSTSKAIAATETLQKMSDKSLALLRSIPPGGEAFTRGVLQVLAREQVWVKWKADKCQAFERFLEDGVEAKNKSETRAMMIAITRAKRKVVAGGDGSLARAKDAKEKRKAPPGLVKLFDSKETNEQILSESAAQVRETSDSVRLKKYRQLVAEAEDPENGIEEEYHPKKESLFCWKALRAMSSAGHLDVFEFIEKTDSEPTGSVITAFKLLNDKEAGVDLKKMAAEAKKDAKMRQAAAKAAQEAADAAARVVELSKADSKDDGEASEESKKRKRGESDEEKVESDDLGDNSNDEKDAAKSKKRKKVEK